MDRFRTLTVALACAVVALVAGLWLGGHPSALPSGLRDLFVEDDRALRAEVIDLIEDNFVREVDRERLERASLQGIVRSLNARFSRYIPPEETAHLRESLEGEFDGVGMSVNEDRRGLLVVKVFEGSPAARARIREGNVITAVDGRSLAGKSTEVGTGLIKGKAGTSVRLTVLDPAGRRSRTLTLKRARIEVPVARGRVVDQGGVKLGVVELLGFPEGAHGRVARELRRLRRDGVRGLVLDLRGNGGGVLEEAQLVSSLFIEDGLIVSTKGRTRPERKLEARGKALVADLPLVVLVDRGSASASEILTGALRHHRRATVVGTRTFGKGVVQEVQGLSNGGALTLTIASFFLPSGESISDRGITPPIRARDRSGTRADEALQVALAALRDKVR